MLKLNYYPLYKHYLNEQLEQFKFNESLLRQANKKISAVAFFWEDMPLIDDSLTPERVMNDGARLAANLTLNLDSSKKVGVVKLSTSAGSGVEEKDVYYLRIRDKEYYFITGDIFKEDRDTGVIGFVELSRFEVTDYEALNDFNFKKTSLTWRLEAYRGLYKAIPASIVEQVILPIEEEIITDIKYSEQGAEARKKFLKKILADKKYKLLEFRFQTFDINNVLVRELTRDSDIDMAFMRPKDSPSSNRLGALYISILICTPERAKAFEHLTQSSGFGFS